MRILTSTSAISGAIEEIVERAKTDLHIVSPYIRFEKKEDQWTRLMNSLKTISEKINIVFITRKPDDKDPKIRQKKIQIIQKKLYDYSDEIWIVPNLHAKCYYNGERALITSMNLYYHSTKDNFEVGVEFEDETKLEYIDNYIRILVGNGEEIRTTEKIVKKIKLEYKEVGDGYLFYSENQEKLGFCIVCEKEMELDAMHLHMVRCKDCWEKKRRGYVKGQYCHICGAQTSTSTNKPACGNCYKQLKKMQQKIEM